MLSMYLLYSVRRPATYQGLQRTLTIRKFQVSISAARKFHTANRRETGKLWVSNKTPLIDEVVKIKITGLQAEQEITLRAERSFGKGPHIMQSFGHYKADSGGLVDVSKHSSLSGSYQGTETMGLFWSLEDVAGQTAGTQLYPRDSRVPIVTNLEGYHGHLDFNVPVDSLKDMKRTILPFDNLQVQGSYLSPDVDRVEIRSGRLRGTLFVPNKGPGPFPAVIDLFGIAGGLAEFRAALLASHGFVTLSLAYFAHDDLPTALGDIYLEYFEEAIDWLVHHPKVKSGGIGMIGSSKGGEISLLTASIRDEVKAVVGINSPHCHVIESMKVNGTPTGCVPCSLQHVKVTKEGFMSTINCWVDPIDNPCEEAAIPVEKINADILLICGEDDQNMPIPEMATRIKNRMAKHGKGHLCKIMIYPKAGHLIEPPFMPLCTGSLHKGYQVIFFWGGEKVHHARAQEDSWKKIILFFHEKLNN